MSSVNVTHIGRVQGKTDDLELFLKVFAGEVLAAFERATVTGGRFLERTITSGKSATFPAFGRATAAYLKPGNSLDDQRTAIEGNEVIVNIDGLLTSSQMITDIEEAMAYYDVRSMFSKQMGEALAVSKDAAILAEVAKMVVAGKENISGAKGTGKGRVINRTITGDVGITEETGKAAVEILLEARAAMSKNSVPADERYAFVTPDIYSALIASLVAINKLYGGVGTIADGNVLRIAGFEMVECPHLTEGGADATNVMQGDGHVFPAAYKDKNPLVICHYSAAATVKIKDLGLEHMRRPDYQADMMVAKYAMGHKGIRPESAFLGVIAKKTA